MVCWWVHDWKRTISEPRDAFDDLEDANCVACEGTPMSDAAGVKMLFANKTVLLSTTTVTSSCRSCIKKKKKKR